MSEVIAALGSVSLMYDALAAEPSLSLRAKFENSCAARLVRLSDPKYWGGENTAVEIREAVKILVGLADKDSAAASSQENKSYAVCNAALGLLKHIVDSNPIVKWQDMPADASARLREIADRLEFKHNEHGDSLMIARLLAWQFTSRPPDAPSPQSFAVTTAKNGPLLRLRTTPHSLAVTSIRPATAIETGRKKVGEATGNRQKVRIKYKIPMMGYKRKHPLVAFFGRVAATFLPRKLKLSQKAEAPKRKPSTDTSMHPSAPDAGAMGSEPA